MYFEIIAALAFALEAKDSYTKGHAERVARYSQIIGQEMNYTIQELKELHLAAFLHDIGKIGVHYTVLNKKDRLDENEFTMIKKHPLLGAMIIKATGVFAHLAPFVQSHHEHWDGSGYPQGLKAKNIPEISRIIAIADTFDALVTDRAYREGLTWQEAISYIEEQSGLLFDPKITSIFIQTLDTINPAFIEDCEFYLKLPSLQPF